MDQQQLANVCRTCLVETGQFQSIFVPDESTGSNIHLAEMIMSYASVQITLGDGLPEDICTQCAQEVAKFYIFKQQCEQSDTALRNRFGISPLNKPCEDKLTVQNLDETKCLDIMIKSEFEELIQKEQATTKQHTHKCDICNKLFSSDAELLVHTDVHSKPSSNHSEAIAEEPETVEMNVVEINPETVLGSDLKGEEISSQNDIEEIVITGPSNLNLFNKTTGDDDVDDKCYMDDNHECDPMKGTAVCTVCGKRFGKSSHLNRHMKIHSIVKPHVCTNCGKSFARAEQLANHMNVHAGVKPHVCKICAKGFNQISNLKDHMRTHNGEKPFLCSTCGKGFNQLGNLRQHTIRHSGIKAHLCSICGNGFASKGELCAHLRKHTGARPFVCPICNHGFTTSSSLTKHKRIHSGEKPYECEVCKMKFSRSGILARHKRTHTGEKPYVCKYCTKAFSQSNDLSSHLRIHTGEKPYICDCCGQAFRQSSALKTHKKTHNNHSGSTIDSKMVMGMVRKKLLDTLK